MGHDEQNHIKLKYVPRIDGRRQVTYMNWIESTTKDTHALVHRDLTPHKSVLVPN